MRISRCSIYSLKLKILQWAHAQRSKEVQKAIMPFALGLLWV